MKTNTKSISVFRTFVTRGLLLASGLIAAGIATAIFFAPDAFYSSYGIGIGSDVSLINELKAPAGVLFIAGLLILAGAFRAEFAVSSLALAAVIYLSYGLSRLLSMAIDGVPHSGLVSAAELEISIGVICLLELMLRRQAGSARRNTDRGGWHSVSKEEAA